MSAKNRSTVLSALSNVNNDLHDLKLSDYEDEVKHIPPLKQNINGDMDIHSHINHNNLDSVNAIINNASNPNYLDIPNNMGQTPLIVVGIFGLSRTVRRLVLAHCNIMHQDRLGDTSLHKCVMNGDIKCVSALVKKISFNEYDMHAKTMSYYLQKVPLVPSDVNIFNNEGLAPIHLAVINGHHQIILLLWKAGAKLNLEV